MLVSACLLGLRTRYDGEDSRREEIVELAEDHCLIPFCPEQLGGLSTPRIPAEIDKGDGATVLQGKARVVREDSVDVTEQFLRGAREAARLAELIGARKAVMKEGSPACGLTRIKRKGADVAGSGVAAALLKRKGVDIEGIE
ncbi:MAG: DUF523 domain-containing protein [Planctomycetes bacterium]|nr:DUF523 domain-containing protein [Planctomycetota bacterium]